MNLCSFILDCVPTAQARVRYTSKTHIAYKSKNQLINEKELETHLMNVRHKYANSVKFPIEGSIGINIAAILPVPKATSKIERSKMLNYEIFPEKKPDIDNLIKQLLDAMTRMEFWVDDKQVVICNTMKIYGIVPHWNVNIFLAERKNLWLQEMCINQ